MITLSVITLSGLQCICFCFSVIRANKHNYLQYFSLFNATLPMIRDFCLGIHFVTTLYLTTVLLTFVDIARFLWIPNDFSQNQKSNFSPNPKIQKALGALGVIISGSFSNLTKPYLS
jgi:hypothetical protein